MNKDIRVLTSFKNHRKRVRLKMVLGESGTDYLIDLWLTAAEDRPDGVLTGWDEIDIAISCGWPGEPQKIVDALIETKWLDRLEDGTYALHDWVDHNGYASSADQRSDKARFSNLKRWHPGIAKKLKAQGVDALTADQFKAITEGHTTDGDDLSVNDPSPIGTDSDTDPIANPPSPPPAPSPSPAIRIDTPLTPQGGKSVSQQLKPALFQKIQEKNLSHCQDKIMEFFEYRMSLEKKSRYKTPKGLDALVGDVTACIAAGLNPVACLDEAMTREWLTPKLDYFANRNGGKRNGSPKSQHNYTGKDDRPSILPERDFIV